MRKKSERETIMWILIKKTGSLILLVCILAGVLIGCGSDDKETITVSNRKVIHEEEFGGIYIDLTIDEFNALGFEYGDSVSITFSNGLKLERIPYYSGFYTKAGETLLVAYPGYPYIEVAIHTGESIWDKSGLKDGDTAEIKLEKRGEFLDVQNARNIQYKDDREAYATDEIFANFRNVEVGNIKKGILYRSASPCDNQHNRAGYVDKLIEKAGVKTILNLADMDETIRGYIKDCEKETGSSDFYSPYFLTIYNSGGVIPGRIAPYYRSEDASGKIGKSIEDMVKREPPYLVHCTEGKDRTGYMCIVLEALCGASLDELRDDYMITYDNYYGITEKNDPDKYNILVRDLFDPLIEIMIGDESIDPKTADLSQYAEKYLAFCGVKKDSIEKLKEQLTKA